MKPGIPFEPHLDLREIKLPPGGEWSPAVRGWLCLRIHGGFGYWQQPAGTCELLTGATLVLPGERGGTLRASQLGGVEAAWFRVDPRKLTGLLSFGEQRALEQTASQERPYSRLFPPQDPLSERFRSVTTRPEGSGLAARLQLLQLFLEAVRPEMDLAAAERSQELDGRGRLRQFLRESPGIEFLDWSLSELAPRMNCSPRHLSRLFHEEVGMPFRRKQTELRLAKACEMLAASDIKLAEVAASSGYDSVSLFSLLFKKRFGVSPGKWRERQRAVSSRPARAVRPAMLCA